MPVSNFNYAVVKSVVLFAAVAPYRSFAAKTPNPRATSAPIERPSQYPASRSYMSVSQQNFKPIPTTPYVITTEDGSRLEIVSHKNGRTQGRLTLLSQIIIDGDFVKNKSGNYVPDGNASRTLLEGITESGTFVTGTFVFGIVKYPTGGIDIGPRIHFNLDGEVCIRIKPTGEIQIGEFKNNEFIKGMSWGGGLPNSFDPYAPLPLLPQDYLETFPLETKRVHGATLRGIVCGTHIVYGQKISDNGEIHEGFLNAAGLLEGIGRRQFPSSEIVESGWYESGNFKSGRVDFGQNVYQIGPRKNTQLHGDNCTDYNNHSLGVGTFDEGNFRPKPVLVPAQPNASFHSGHINSGVAAVPSPDRLVGRVSPDPELNHVAHTNLDGTQDYFIKGKKVFSGIPYTTNGCDDVLNKHQTPLLFDPKKIMQYIEIYDQSDTIANDAFLALIQPNELDSEEREFLKIVKRFGLDKLDVRHDIHFQSRKLHNPDAQLGKYEKRVAKFIANALIKELGIDYCRRLCMSEFKEIISTTKTAITGMRTLSRPDEVITRNNRINTALPIVLAAFLDTTNSAIQQLAPHFKIETTFSFEVEDSKLRVYIGVTGTDTEQFASLLAATPDGGKGRYAEIIDQDDKRLMGLGYRIPVEAINQFAAGPQSASDKRPEVVPIHAGIFYRYRGDDLGDVNACAKGAYENLDRQISLQRSDTVYSSFVNFVTMFGYGV